jgi:hypothetical protein
MPQETASDVISTKLHFVVDDCGIPIAHKITKGER